MSDVPLPFQTLDADLQELGQLIRKLPDGDICNYFDILPSVKKVRSELAIQIKHCPNNFGITDLLRLIMDAEPTGNMTVIALERFQGHCPANSEMFGCVTKNSNVIGPLSKNHYFNVMPTQAPTIDRSTGLETVAPLGSIHCAHDIYNLKVHEEWDYYKSVYGSNPGASWLTVRLQSRLSHVYKSSQRAYHWAINVDYHEDSKNPSSRIKGSTAYLLRKYFFHIRESIEDALSMLRVHSPEHNLVAAYDTAESNRGVIVCNRRYNEIIAANCAAERVLRFAMKEEVTGPKVLSWLNYNRKGEWIRDHQTLANGDELFVISRSINSITITEWSGPLLTRLFPTREQARVELRRLTESGQGIVVDSRSKIGFQCVFLPFRNHVGVGVDPEGGTIIQASQFQKMKNETLCNLLVKVGESPVIIMWRTLPLVMVTKMF